MSSIFFNTFSSFVYCIHLCYMISQLKLYNFLLWRSEIQNMAGPKDSWFSILYCTGKSRICHLTEKQLAAILRNLTPFKNRIIIIKKSRQTEILKLNFLKAWDLCMDFYSEKPRIWKIWYAYVYIFFHTHTHTKKKTLSKNNK